MLPLTEADQRSLLGLARWAIEEGVFGRSRTRPRIVLPACSEPCGAFVTLHRRGVLRGCIGHIRADWALQDTVAECAASAALDDPRFPPVTAEELADLRIEISVLSPLADILPPDIEIGRHGLFVSQGLHRGVLLPQVATEWQWTPERFLEETCSKAGLPADAWQHGARIQAFTTQVFREAEGSGRATG